MITHLPEFKKNVCGTKRVVKPIWNSNQFHNSNHDMNAYIPIGFSKGIGNAGTRGNMQGQSRPFVTVQKISQLEMEERIRN
jgi:hypothetical protein